MTRIGSRKTAKLLVESLNETSRAPEGFNLIGSGSFRSVYLHVEENVVYKVDDGYDDGDYDNVREYRNAKTLRRMADENGVIGKHIRIPAVTGYDINGSFVIAMEYVGGTMGATARVPNAARKELYKIGKFHDMHGYNYKYDNGYIIPIDMGSLRAKCHTNPNVDRRILTGGL